MLTEEKLKSLESKLFEEKAKVEKQLLKFAKKDKEIPGNYKTKFPDIGEEVEENAQEVAEYEQNISLEHSLEEELDQINRALIKIKEGKYGICENCGVEIPLERLEIRPQSRVCVSCKQKSE